MDDKRYFLEYVLPRYPAPRVPAIFASPINEMDIAPSAEVEVIPKLYIAVVGSIGLQISVTNFESCENYKFVTRHVF